MKTLLSVMVSAVILSAFVYAETYTTEEFIVEGQPTTCTPVAPACGQTVTTTTVATVPGTVVVSPAGTTTTVITTSTEAPIYVGMSKYHVVEAMGEPTQVEKFKNFAGRKQGIYDEVWTYQTPTGNIVVYIKERRVAKIEK